jgi:hypothetical protein
MVTPRLSTVWLPLSGAFGARDDRDGVPVVERVPAIHGARVRAVVVETADAGARVGEKLSSEKIVPLH